MDGAIRVYGLVLRLDARIHRSPVSRRAGYGVFGYLVYEGRLHLLLAVSLAWLGTSIGTTVTYFAGRRLGHPFLAKHGPKLFLGPKKLARATGSFEKYGSKLLFLSFFVPGVRHFTGYLAGMLNVPFRKYALYTYSGALLWTVVFIVGGRLLGSQWEQIHEIASRYGGDVLLYAAVLAWLIYSYRSAIHDPANRMLRKRNGGDPPRWSWLFIGALGSAAGMFVLSAHLP
ncbi:DedA family protein [Cohnella sp. CFH 77786]|uniref:DedA family protein n=1 Tax=Cohnella sp. CFH 77786 TaxID=2662265 RepID=UPI001C609BC8|nr:DedA family protein [Cohnella sp. CFH 77786]MBW5447164.1 DedA family protein [Cohnella sp. CFH 77786]